MESYYIWQAQLRRWQLDVNIIENTPLFPVKVFAAEAKGPGQTLVYVVFGPEDAQSQHSHLAPC